MVASCTLQSCAIYGTDLLTGVDSTGGGPAFLPENTKIETDGSGGAPSATPGAGGQLIDATTGGTTAQGGAPPVDDRLCAQFPLSSRALWAATASSFAYEPPLNDSPDRAIDRGELTRWATGASMTSSDWFLIDFGANVALSGLNILHDGEDYARAYEIVFDEEPPTPLSQVLLQGTNQLSDLNLEFPTPQVGHYLLIRQTGSAGNWWSVKEILLYCDEP